MPRDIEEQLRGERKERRLNRQEFIEKMTKKAKKRKPVRAREDISKRGTLFAIRNKRIAIREAALRRVQIIITYKKVTTGEIVKRIVAPYEWRYMRMKEGWRKVFWGYDMKDKHIKSFYNKYIRNVVLTDRKFVPKWKILIH